MLLTIIEKGTLHISVAQIGTSSQFYGVSTESLFHARQVIGFVLRMNPFIQKKVHNVTQQQRPGIPYRLETHQEIIGRMMSIIFKAFGQCTDVNQIIGFQNKERRRQYTRLIHVDIQQVELCPLPEATAGFIEFIIHLGHMTTHTQRSVDRHIGRKHIEKTSLGILISNPQSFSVSLGRRRNDVDSICLGKKPVQAFRNSLPCQAPDKKSQCLGITQQMFLCRLGTTVQDVVGCQAESVQTVLLHHGKAQLS